MTVNSKEADGEWKIQGPRGPDRRNRQSKSRQGETGPSGQNQSRDSSPDHNPKEHKRASTATDGPRQNSAAISVTNEKVWKTYVCPTCGEEGHGKNDMLACGRFPVLDARHKHKDSTNMILVMMNAWWSSMCANGLANNPAVIDHAKVLKHGFNARFEQQGIELPASFLKMDALQMPMHSNGGNVMPPPPPKPMPAQPVAPPMPRSFSDATTGASRVPFEHLAHDSHPEIRDHHRVFHPEQYAQQPAASAPTPNPYGINVELMREAGLCDEHIAQVMNDAKLLHESKVKKQKSEELTAMVSALMDGNHLAPICDAVADAVISKLNQPQATHSEHHLTEQLTIATALMRSLNQELSKMEPTLQAMAVNFNELVDTQLPGELDRIQTAHQQLATSSAMLDTQCKKVAKLVASKPVSKKKVLVDSSGESDNETNIAPTVPTMDGASDASQSSNNEDATNFLIEQFMQLTQDECVKRFKSVMPASLRLPTKHITLATKLAEHQLSEMGATPQKAPTAPPSTPQTVA